MSTLLTGSKKAQFVQVPRGKGIKAGTAAENLQGEIRWENIFEMECETVSISFCHGILTMFLFKANLTEDIKATSGVDAVLPAMVHLRPSGARKMTPCKGACRCPSAKSLIQSLYKPVHDPCGVLLFISSANKEWLNDNMCLARQAPA